MKKSLLLKRIDFWLQILVFVGSIVAASITKNLESRVLPYLAVGTTLLISCLANVIFRNKGNMSKGRKAYHTTLFVIAVSGGLCSLIPTILVGIMYGMLYAAPCLAVWYLAITAKELKNLQEQKRILNL